MQYNTSSGDYVGEERIKLQRGTGLINIKYNIKTLKEVNTGQHVKNADKNELSVAGKKKYRCIQEHRTYKSETAQFICRGGEII